MYTIKEIYMKKFEKLLKGHKSLVFLDFEGTQFSHEMIAIGALHVVIDRHGYIKKAKKPFRAYVKAHNRVGKIVTDLTGTSAAFAFKTNEITPEIPNIATKNRATKTLRLKRIPN